MSKRSNIVPLSRDYRRPPKWGMGLPPRKPRRRRFGLFLVVALIVVAALVPVLDVVRGFAVPTEGCRVFSVVDGDTVKIYCKNKKRYSARILAYDAPELFSPQCVSEHWLAIRATAYLHWQLWTASQISVIQQDTDRYGRRLIVLQMDGEGVAGRMVQAGLGRWYDGGRRAGWCDAKGESDV